MNTKVIFSGKNIDKSPNKKVSANKPKPSGARKSKTKFEDIDLTSSIGDIYRKSRNRHSKTPSASVKRTTGKDSGASGNTANKYYKNSNRDTTVERDKNESKLIRLGTNNKSRNYTNAYTGQPKSQRSSRIAPPVARPIAPPSTQPAAPPVARPIAPPSTQPAAPPVVRPIAPPTAPPITNNMRTTRNRVNPPGNNNIGNQTYVKTDDISSKQQVVQKTKQVISKKPIRSSSSLGKPVISKKPIRPTSSLGKPVISKKPIRPASTLGKPSTHKNPIKPLSNKVCDVDNNDSRDSANVTHDSLGETSMNKYNTVRVKTDLNSFKKTTEYVDWDVYNSNAIQLEHFKRLSSIEDKYLTKLISQDIIINKIDSD